MIKKYHRVHLRLNEQQYAALKEKSKNAGMTMNWFMTKRLAELQPFYFPVEEISALTEYTNEQGNLIKTSSVSAGYGSKTLLLETIEILSRTQSRKHALMKKKQQTDGKWFKQPGCRLVRISCEENYNREQKN